MSNEGDGGIVSWLMSENTGTWILKTTLMLVLFALSFVCARCMGAVNGSSVSEIRKKAEHDDRNAEKALALLEKEDKILDRCRAGILFCTSACTVLTGISTAAAVCGVLKKMIPDNLFMLTGAAVLLFTVMLCVLVFYSFAFCAGEKTGEQRSEELLLNNSGIYLFVTSLFIPISTIGASAADLIARFSGRKISKDANQRTEEEIMQMVDEGEESGAIEENTKDMIENVFEFDDRCVDEVMTHRKDVTAVKLGSLITDAVEKAISSGKSRLPVYGDDIDDIEGILYVKDLLKYVCTDVPRDTITKEMLKEAVFVPESKHCSEMFEYMTENKTQIAVVVDEFGGTGGIITMEDLIESIVGNIQDEYDNEDDEIKKVDDRSFTVPGSTSLDEISELTGLNFEDEEDDTIAGIMLDRMGHIPKSGEHPSVVINGTRFTVQEVEDRRISKILVVKPAGRE